MQGAVDARFDSPKSLFLPSQLRENCVAGGSHFGGEGGSVHVCFPSAKKRKEGGLPRKDGLLRLCPHVFGVATDRPSFQPWMYVVDFNFTRKAPPLSVAAVFSLEPWPQVFVPQFFFVGWGGLK